MGVQPFRLRKFEHKSGQQPCSTTAGQPVVMLIGQGQDEKIANLERATSCICCNTICSWPFLCADCEVERPVWQHERGCADGPLQQKLQRWKNHRILQVSALTESNQPGGPERLRSHPDGAKNCFGGETRTLHSDTVTVLATAVLSTAVLLTAETKRVEQPYGINKKMSKGSIQ